MIQPRFLLRLFFSGLYFCESEGCEGVLPGDGSPMQNLDHSVSWQCTAGPGACMNHWAT